MEQSIQHPFEQNNKHHSFGKRVLSTHRMLAACLGCRSWWQLWGDVENGWTATPNKRKNTWGHVAFVECLLIDFNAALRSHRVAAWCPPDFRLWLFSLPASDDENAFISLPLTGCAFTASDILITSTEGST